MGLTQTKNLGVGHLLGVAHLHPTTQNLNLKSLHHGQRIVEISGDAFQPETLQLYILLEFPPLKMGNIHRYIRYFFRNASCLYNTGFRRQIMVV